MAFEELDDATAKFFQTGQLEEELTPGGESIEPTVFTQHEVFDVPADPVVAEPAPVVPEVAEPAPNPYLERLLAEQDAATKRLQAELDALKAAKDAPVPEEPIDPAVDPLGALMQQQRQIKEQIAAMKAEQTTALQETKQLTQQQQMVGELRARVAEFEKTHADYNLAFKHVSDLRTEEYRIRGMTQAQIEKSLNDEYGQIVGSAMQNGKNPAEVIYTLAQKYGYKAPAAPVTKPTPTETLERVKKGQQAANTSLQRAAPPTEVTPDSLNEMSDAEMTRAVMHDWDKLFGREKGFI